MDHAKIVSLVSSYKTKNFDRLTKLFVSVTGMLTYGHGNIRHIFYRLDLYLHDANYTIGSITKLLQDLELSPKS